MLFDQVREGGGKFRMGGEECGQDSVVINSGGAGGSGGGKNGGVSTESPVRVVVMVGVVASGVTIMVRVGSGMGWVERDVRWSDVDWKGGLCWIVSRVVVVVLGWWRNGSDVSGGFVRGRLKLKRWMKVGEIAICGNVVPQRRWGWGCKKAVRGESCFVVGRFVRSGRNC
jgi:hypothetical protein